MSESSNDSEVFCMTCDRYHVRGDHSTKTSQGEAPTGGEWRVATHAHNDHWRGDGTEVLSDYGRIAETYVSGLRNIDECRANARLIAAAPDLLAALRSFVNAAKSWHECHHPIGLAAVQCDWLCECIPAGEAALNRACQQNTSEKS